MKRIFTLALAALMLFALAACGETQSAATPTSGGNAGYRAG